VTKQPEDKVCHRSKESDRRKASPADGRVSVCGEHVERRILQSVEKEGQVRVELAPPRTLHVAVNPIQEGRTCERGDHDHVRSNPSQDNVRPGIPVAVSLLRGSIPGFFLGWGRVL